MKPFVDGLEQYCEDHLETECKARKYVIDQILFDEDARINHM